MKDTPQLPLEIQHYIIDYLSGKPLKAASAVSKQWREYIFAGPGKKPLTFRVGDNEAMLVVVRSLEHSLKNVPLAFNLLNEFVTDEDIRVLLSELEKVQALHRLKELTVKSIECTDEIFELLPSSLEKLDLTRCTFLNEDPKNLPAGLKEVHFSDLSGMPTNLQFLPPQLNFLGLYNCKLPQEEGLHALPVGLKNLFIFEADITDKTLHEIGTTCQKLTTLMLENSQGFTHQGFSYLPASLKELTLVGSVGVTDKVLASLPRSLEKLNIIRSRPAPRTLKPVQFIYKEGLKGLPPQLKELSLSTCVTSEILSMLPSALEMLYMYDNVRLSPEEMQLLPQQLTSLEFCKWRELTDKHFTLLPPQISKVVFWGSPSETPKVTVAGIKILLQKGINVEAENMQGMLDEAKSNLSPTATSSWQERSAKRQKTAHETTGVSF